MRNFAPVLAALVGCGSEGPAPQHGGTTDAGSTSFGTQSVPTMAIDPIETTSSSSSGSDSRDGAGGGFIADVASVPRCPPLEGDCPRGEVCRRECFEWSCVAMEAEPDRVGEACTVDADTCVDSCEPLALCLHGTCRRYCDGQESNPVCDDADESCLFVGEQYPMLCVPQCDALAQDCPAGLGCWWHDDTFMCLPHVDEGADGYGDACSDVNACPPGHHCVAAERVPGCEMGGCCTPYCDPEEDACPGEGQVCARLFERHEEVGLCVVPD